MSVQYGYIKKYACVPVFVFKSVLIQIFKKISTCYNILLLSIRYSVILYQYRQ